MPVTTPVFSCASSAALVLALSQAMLAPAALATEAQSAPTPPAAAPATAIQTPPSPPAPAPAPVASPSSAESASAPADERQRRYAELRARAAELGVAMPEAPPWDAARPEPPRLPEPPEMNAREKLWQEDDATLRQWREDMQTQMRERMRAMTPEERQTMREERWKRMRAEATERGVEMPATPPWEEAEKRRQEMAQRFEEYRKIVEQMTDAQREAARAIFGRPAAGTARPDSRPDAEPGRESWNAPGAAGYDPRGMAYPPMLPYQGAPAYEQGRPPWGTGY